MKKTKLKEFLCGRLRDFREVLRKYPVEMAIATICFLNAILVEEWHQWDKESICSAAPLVFTLSYILNRVFRRGKVRVVYYLSWIPLAVPFFFDIDSWAFSTAYFIEFLCLLLAVPVFTGRRDNEGFVADNCLFFSGVIISLILCGVAWGLFFALVNCTSELFKLGWYHTRAEVYFGFFAFTVMFALFALSYLDRYRGSLPEKTGVMAVLLDYILTPAILAFNALFYAYFVKIALQWSLPEGYVAIMVFVFALVAFVVKALRELLPVKRYSWYYDNLTYIAIPAVALFWIGTVYRIAEYGFTESRVYLVVCGLIMTVSLALFACKGKGRYRASWISAIVLLLLFTVFPPISAAKIGLWSQEKRLVKLATELNLLEGPRKLKETVVLENTHPETIAMLEQLREALRYLSFNNGPDYGAGYYYSYGYDYIWEPGDYVHTLTVYSEHGVEVMDMSGITYAVRLEKSYRNGAKYIYDADDKYMYIFWNGEGPQLLPYSDSPLPDGYRMPEKGYKAVWMEPIDDVIGALLTNAELTEDEIKLNDFSLTKEQERKISVYDGERFILVFDRLYIYFEPYGNTLSSSSAVWMYLKK